MNVAIHAFRSVTIVAFVGMAASVGAAEPALKSAPAAAVRLRIGSWEDVQKLVAAERGKVVVVDVWTTTCATCVERFPEFVALEKKFGPERVATISVNCDYDGIRTKPPEYYRKEVEEFLRKQRAPGEHVLLDVPFVEFLERMKLESTPAAFVYAADGTLAKRFDNDGAETEAEEFRTADVARLIESLLAKSK